MRRLVLFALSAAAINLVLSDAFQTRILLLTLLWASAAVAWNLTAKGGQISLGHSAFVGLAAYSIVVLTSRGWSPWTALPLAMVVAAAAALLIGAPTFRLQGFYFGLATMIYPLVLMLIVIFVGYREETIPYHPGEEWAWMQFRDPHMYVWLAIGLAVVTLAIAELISRSRVGLYLDAIKGNQVLAESFGVRAALWKNVAFVLSASLTAVMAVLWINGAIYVVTADNVFSLGVALQILAIAFVGGVGTVWGPVLGAALLVPLTMLLSATLGDRLPASDQLVYGLSLVVIALVAPQGLVRLVDRLWRRVPLPWSRALREEPLSERGDESATTGRVLADDATLLVVRDVRRSFGGVQALRGVSFDIRCGELVGLIGPNGAGKTTLFNILTGLLPPDGGRIMLGGKDITKASPAARCRLGIARTFQVPQGFGAMTVFDNVLVAATGSGCQAEPRAATWSALQLLGLAAKAQSPLSALTTLDAKLLDLARAVVARPALLLVDEPLAGLNPAERDRLIRVLQEIAGRGVTVAMVEHSVRSLVTFAKRVIALVDGAIVVDGTPGDVVRHQVVIESYLGKKWAVGASGS